MTEPVESTSHDPDLHHHPDEENTVTTCLRSGPERFWIPWDVVLALTIFTFVYTQLNHTLRLGPVWLLPAVLIGLFVIRIYAHISERHREARLIALAVAGISTIAIQVSIGTLVARLIHGNVSAPYLLRDAAALWVLNVIIFGVWYWEIDGGGPHVRYVRGYRPTDLAFPQIALGPTFSKDWMPKFIDYLFVAFNASAAFSPTDTSFLSRRSKILMMAQAMNSVVLLAVVAARAINTLH